MPELAEVESLRLKLEPQILGATVKKVVLRRKDLRYPITPGLAKKLPTQKIESVKRRSKYLLLNTNADQTLVIHLGMTGRFFFADPKVPYDKHDHVIFDLKDGRQLRFRDPRRFGMMFLMDAKTLPENKFFKHLGVEPLTEAFHAEWLYQKCKKAKTPIKSLLMNAKVLVGVGNIYANESLFLSGVRPTRQANRITRQNAEDLCANIKKVLSESIAVGGTSIRDYVGVDETPGLYKLQLYVYGRTGEACQVCQETIKHLTQTGRSSFYCPRCQR